MGACVADAHSRPLSRDRRVATRVVGTEQRRGDPATCLPSHHVMPSLHHHARLAAAGTLCCVLVRLHVFLFVAVLCCSEVSCG